VSRETASIVFGGLAPLIAAALVTVAGGSYWLVALYIVGACLVTLITGLIAPETFRRTTTSRESGGGDVAESAADFALDRRVAGRGLD
jgi:hypothetical protein